jgi:hypothetical protein
MFDASPVLQEAARELAPRGFRGGAEWMALALAVMRGTRVEPPRAGATGAGLAKYAAATAGGGVAALLLAPIHWSAAAAGFVAAFYLIEAQGVFVFPALAAGSPAPWKESRALVGSAGGTLPVVARTVVLAAVMLLGGFAGRGFLRSWCIGCLAVVIWYEGLRR